MIFVTGDTHGTVDLRKLGSKWFDGSRLTKDDYVIICGDFGLVWENSPSERWWLNWLERKPFTTLFVDGNHEGFALLDSLPTEIWHGGRIHRIRPSVIHLMRGELFDIDGLRFFAMGGAYSMPEDKRWRIEGVSWFPQEVPSDEERAHAIETLDRAQWNVDYVLTHCAPACVVEEIFESDARHPADEYCAWLEDAVMSKLSYRQWFCGHYHVNAAFSHRVTVLYGDIVRIAGSDDGEDNEGNAGSRPALPSRIVEDDPANWASPSPTPAFDDWVSRGCGVAVSLSEQGTYVTSWPAQELLWEMELPDVYAQNNADDRLRCACETLDALLEPRGYEQVVTKNAARCEICGDYVESTSVHDMAWCACGNVAVDGGHEYVRRCFKTDRYANDIAYGWVPKGEAAEERRKLDRLSQAGRSSSSFSMHAAPGLYEIVGTDEAGNRVSLISTGETRAEAVRPIRNDNPDLTVESITRIEDL